MTSTRSGPVVVRALNLIVRIGVVHTVVDGHGKSRISNCGEAHSPAPNNFIDCTIHVGPKQATAADRNLIAHHSVDVLANVLAGRPVLGMVVIVVLVVVVRIGDAGRTVEPDGVRQPR